MPFDQAVIGFSGKRIQQPLSWFKRAQAGKIEQSIDHLEVI